MSSNARRHKKSNRRLCACGRHAQYYSWARRAWRWRPDHPLCSACHRSELDAHAARRLAWRLRTRRGPTRRVVPGAEAA